MEQTDIIYFDNAATSFPKPATVYDEVRSTMLFCGGNAGRGAHKLSMSASRKIFDCRMAAAELFGCDTPENIAFTMNTTYALNIAIKGLLSFGDRVIISDLEHNAVYRPICALARERGIKYDIFDTGTLSDASDANICEGIKRLIVNETKMVVCTCASNICSRILPIERIGRLCRDNGLIFVVDAAQGAGHIDIDIKRMNIDVLCVPSHKGLYGPQGCGMLIFGDRVDCGTLIEGGNGYDSLNIGMGEILPEKFEAGTMPAPIIAGLCAGINSVMEVGVEQIASYERALYRRAVEMLGNSDGIRVYAPVWQGSVLLFNMDGATSEQIASELDRYGICVRGGYHCAPLAHRTLGTKSGGAVRLSFGRYNKMSELERFWRALKKIREDACGAGL